MKTGLAALALLFLAGCAGKPEVSGINILDEVNSLKSQLGCAWEKYPDPMYPAKGGTYACVLDRFNSVMFFVHPSDEILDKNAPAIEKITLIWKEWHDNAHIVDGRIPASRGIAYVAQRFFPPKMATRLVETFLGKQNRTHSYKKLKARYRYEKQLTLNLHQMDLINQDRHKRMFAFPPLHTHQKQEEKTDAAEPDKLNRKKPTQENQKKEGN